MRSSFLVFLALFLTLAVASSTKTQPASVGSQGDGCKTLKNCHQRGACLTFGMIEKCECIYGFLGVACGVTPPEIAEGSIVPGGISGLGVQHYKFPASTFKEGQYVVVKTRRGRVVSPLLFPYCGAEVSEFWHPLSDSLLDTFASIGRIPAPNDFQYTVIGTEKSATDEKRVFIENAVPSRGALGGDLHLYVTVQGTQQGGENEYELWLGDEYEEPGIFGEGVDPGVAIFLLILIILLVIGAIVGAGFAFYKFVYMPRFSKQAKVEKIKQAVTALQTVQGTQYQPGVAGVGQMAAGTQYADASSAAMYGQTGTDQYGQAQASQYVDANSAAQYGMTGTSDPYGGGDLSMGAVAPYSTAVANMYGQDPSSMGDASTMYGGAYLQRPTDPNGYSSQSMASVSNQYAADLSAGNYSAIAGGAGNSSAGSYAQVYGGYSNQPMY